MDIRYRYNKKKNTLATIREGDNVYFGISKCHLSAGDSFNKDRGRRIALGRAMLEKETFKTGIDFNIHVSGLRGYCNINHIVDVLKYFDDVDKNFYRLNFNCTDQGYLCAEGGCMADFDDCGDCDGDGCDEVCRCEGCCK
jgi:hypothetical protein